MTTLLEVTHAAPVANTQLFAKSGKLVADVYLPPVVADAIMWRGRVFVLRVGRYVEATMYEVRG